MKQFSGALAFCLLLLAETALCAQEESMTAETLAFDFAQRLLVCEGEKWESEYVQKAVRYLSEEKQAALLELEEANKLLRPKFLIPFRKKAIAEKAENLPDEKKELLYAVYKESAMSPVGTAFLSWTPPGWFGMASFIQGDVLGGSVQALTAIISYSCLFSAAGKEEYVGEKKLRAGFGWLIANRIVGSAMPFVFSALCNSSARSGLGVGRNGKALQKSPTSQNLVFVPTFNPVENEYGFTVALQF